MKRILSFFTALVLFAPSVVFGGDFYDRLDVAEQQAMMETLQYALEKNREGEESSWANPETGNSGAVVPLDRFFDENGYSCRNFIATIVIDKDEERNSGTACLQEDGMWSVVESQISTSYAARISTRYVYVYRDPYRYWYPWVYYAPYDYPHRIFFSFVFSSRHGHFRRSCFHDGRRYVGSHHYSRSAPRVHRPGRVFSAPGARSFSPKGNHFTSRTSHHPRSKDRSAVTRSGVRSYKAGSRPPTSHGAKPTFRRVLPRSDGRKEPSAGLSSPKTRSFRQGRSGVSATLSPSRAVKPPRRGHAVSGAKDPGRIATRENRSHPLRGKHGGWSGSRSGGRSFDSRGVAPKPGGGRAKGEWRR